VSALLFGAFTNNVEGSTPPSAAAGRFLKIEGGLAVGRTDLPLMGNQA
jgi:hypothetical protein